MVSIVPLVPFQFLSEAIFLCSTLKPRNNDLIDSFFDYLSRTWFSENAKFSKYIWSHSENFSARTNNNLEGFHSKLNKLLRKAHPNFFEVLKFIKEVQYENEIDLQIYLTSGKQRPKIAKYAVCPEKIDGIKG